MPRGHEHNPEYSLSIYVCFSGQFFFKKWIVTGKKDRFAMLGCNNDHLISREIYSEVLFLPEKCA